MRNLENYKRKETKKMLIFERKILGRKNLIWPNFGRMSILTGYDKQRGARNLLKA